MFFGDLSGDTSCCFEESVYTAAGALLLLRRAEGAPNLNLHFPHERLTASCWQQQQQQQHLSRTIVRLVWFAQLLHVCGAK